MGDAVIRTLVDTSSVEATTITYHATNFAKLVVEEDEKKHGILRNMHVALTHDLNRLFIENVRLTKDLAKRDIGTLIGPKPEYFEQLKEDL